MKIIINSGIGVETSQPKIPEALDALLTHLKHEEDAEQIKD